LSAITQATKLQQLLQGGLEASRGKPPDRRKGERKADGKHEPWHARAEGCEVMGSPGAAA
jgi:hypothetical protein